jgi:hypothetical protein
MWIDRPDWESELERRAEAGVIVNEMADKISKFIADGYVVLPGAASERNISRFEYDISAAFRQGHDKLVYQNCGDPTRRSVTAGMSQRGIRIVDAFACLPSALDLFSSPRLMGFLQAIFGEVPLLFQSLSFDRGSEQGLHQDTAYVVVDRPLELAACWIALEDIAAGTGELMYLPGSHRFPDWDFGGNKKHWDPHVDGAEPHDCWARWLIEEGQRRGLQVERFIARRGDILVWHADLAHGGAAILNPAATRKSLVGHFCPASARPNYFGYAPQRANALRHRGLNYASEHYDLALPHQGPLARLAGRFRGGVRATLSRTAAFVKGFG